MKQKEEVVEKLNEVILQFEETTKIVNYAIVFNNRIVLSPNSTHFKKQYAVDILKNINVEDLEKKFQKGDLTSLDIEFENEKIYYVKCTPQVRIIASPKKGPAKDVKRKLLSFASDIRGVLNPISDSEPSDETEEKINQSLVSLDDLIKNFKIPDFKSFKRLVKFAIPFNKK